MKDTKNLKKKVNEYSNKINDLIASHAKITEVNYWRRQLNSVHADIREREANRLKNEKQFKKAN